MIDTRKQRLTRGAFLAVLLTGCSSKPAGPVDRYELEGEVIRFDAGSRLALIRHGDIKNAQGKVWMAAMTMEFPVKEKADREKLKDGIRIKAGLYQRPSDFEYWIAEVQVVGK